MLNGIASPLTCALSRSTPHLLRSLDNYQIVSLFVDLIKYWHLEPLQTISMSIQGVFGSGVQYGCPDHIGCPRQYNMSPPRQQTMPSTFDHRRGRESAAGRLRDVQVVRTPGTGRCLSQPAQLVPSTWKGLTRPFQSTCKLSKVLH